MKPFHYLISRSLLILGLFIFCQSSVYAINSSLGCFHRGKFYACPAGVPVGAGSVDDSGALIVWTKDGQSYIGGTNGTLQACPSPPQNDVNIPDTISRPVSPVPDDR